MGLRDRKAFIHPLIDIRETRTVSGGGRGYGGHDDDDDGIPATATATASHCGRHLRRRLPLAVGSTRGLSSSCQRWRTSPKERQY